MQAANYLTLLSAEDILRQRGQGLRWGSVSGTKTDDVGHHKEVQDTWNGFSPTREW